MSELVLNLEDEVLALLRQVNPSVSSSAREFIILELYRRGAISDGKAAQLLEMSRPDFRQYAARLGFPYFSFTQEEWADEILQSQKL
jgi:predicted HTH domain antitoxin